MHDRTQQTQNLPAMRCLTPLTPLRPHTMEIELTDEQLALIEDREEPRARLRAVMRQFAVEGAGYRSSENWLA